MDERQKIIDDLFLKNYDHVVRAARWHAPDAEVAADVVQQAYLEFSRRAREGKWDLALDLAPLLYRLTQLIALRTWRERQKNKPENLRKLADFLRQRYEERDLASLDEYQGESLRYVKDCLAELPPKHRELIENRYFKDMSNQELADAKRIPLRNVQQTIRRLREKIRRCIERKTNDL